ncbi:hypothetical protein HAX54_034048 [Datura stramonium]|uniref:Uncharacterized protein n=1 Tax=Datura stramonium TaxID=4076 RepID=A0ABS8SE28_DATST|nr:hypothetical protein [Datura stramonium]
MLVGHGGERKKEGKKGVKEFRWLLGRWWKRDGDREEVRSAWGERKRRSRWVYEEHERGLVKMEVLRRFGVAAVRRSRRPETVRRGEEKGERGARGGRD